MKSIVTKVAVILAFALIGTTFARAQRVIAVQQRHVPGANIQTFLEEEATYWAEVARHAIKNGKMTRWELWRSIGGENLDEAPNFMFLNILDDPSVLDDLSEIWNPMKVFPNVEWSEMATDSLGILKGQYFYAGHEYLVKTPPKILRVNLGRVPDVDRYLELERSVWKPFIEKQMESGRTRVTSWRVAVLLSPRGSIVSHNVVSVDGFQTLSDALLETFDEDVELPDLAEMEELREIVDVQHWQLVKVVGPEV